MNKYIAVLAAIVCLVVLSRADDGEDDSRTLGLLGGSILHGIHGLGHRLFGGPGYYGHGYGHHHEHVHYAHGHGHGHGGYGHGFHGGHGGAPLPGLYGPGYHPPGYGGFLPYGGHGGHYY